MDELAVSHDLTVEALEEKMEGARRKLLTAREARVYPHVDDKILASWNGMMIAALAKAGRVFGDQMYIDSAARAITFIERNLVQGGRLMARYRDGETKYKGFLDDHAYVIWAYLELYDATFSPEYVQNAKSLAEDMLNLFWDEDDGGFYLTGDDGEKLISREKEIFDDALPSGNGTASVMLVRLGYLSGETDYLDRAEEMFYSFYQSVNRLASASTFFLQSLLLMEYRTKEVVILAPYADPAREKLMGHLQKAFLPDVSLLAAERPEIFKEAAPYAADYRQQGEEATIYICENFVCRQPTTDAEGAIEDIMGT